jgi:Putative peptidoglycan binding domain
MKAISMYIKIFIAALVMPLVTQIALGETVTGNGYSVQQTFTPVEGALVGNGYQVNQTAQPLSGLFSVTGFILSSGQKLSSTSSVVVTPPVIPPVVPPPSSGGGSNGGGFYVLPPSVTGDYPATTTIGTTTPARPPVKQGSVITDNGSSCSTRIIFSSPIDSVLVNVSDDVKKLERFLNEYEGANLPVNGIYEKRDIDAVKKWQLKYRSAILDPMRLKEPTGTIYTLSMRQIERQTTVPCGVPVVINACPFFKANVRYGNRGEEVRKVQQFLNIVQGERLPLSGVFGPLTRDAVKRFQKSNRIYVATFIPFNIATGNWFTTTRTKANETIGCDVLN